jgi:hypothetical protein
VARSRESRLDIVLRTWWARLLAAILIAAVATLLWIAGFNYFRDELGLDFLAWPVGIAIAIGAYLAIGYVYRQFGPKAHPMQLSRGVLVDRADAQLRRLQPVTHFVHPLGRPWPKAVCGPNGVYIVDPKPAPGHVGFLDGQIRIDGEPPPAEWIGEVRRLQPIVRELLQDRRSIDIAVAGVLVVDEATIVPAGLREGDVEIAVVPVNELTDHVEFGRPVSIDTARAAYDALAAWRPAS